MRKKNSLAQRRRRGARRDGVTESDVTTPPSLKRIHARRAMWVRFFIALGVTCLVAALILGGWMIGSSASNDQRSWNESTQAVDRVKRFTAQRRNAELEAARAYNRRLASRPQVLGDVLGHKGAFSGTKEYRSLLQAPGDIMAVLVIPRLNLELTVHHGCEDDVLQTALGHLPGSSLPVGGTSTRPVIEGHRGLPGHTLFTYLPSLQKGDLIFVRVLGMTLAYRVYAKTTIEPTDTDFLRIKKGQDILSLVTCTPYGVNTKRFVVDARRTKWPLNGKTPSTTPPWVLWALLAAALLLIIGLIAWARIASLRRRLAALHALNLPAHGYFRMRRHS